MITGNNAVKVLRKCTRVVHTLRFSALACGLLREIPPTGMGEWFAPALKYKPYNFYLPQKLCQGKNTCPLDTRPLACYVQPMENTNTPTPTRVDPFSLPTTFERISELIRQNRFQLFDDQVVARVDLEQVYGSLIIPDQAQRETNTATVVLAAGNLDPTLYKPGTKLLPVQHEGRELCSSGNARLVLYDVSKDLHAIFVED